MPFNADIIQQYAMQFDPTYFLNELNKFENPSGGGAQSQVQSDVPLGGGIKPGFANMLQPAGGVSGGNPPGLPGIAGAMDPRYMQMIQGMMAHQRPPSPSPPGLAPQRQLNVAPPQLGPNAPVGVPTLAQLIGR
jgi:hypothetical protein